MIFPPTSELASLATGRQTPLFSADVEQCRDRLVEMIEGTRLLIIGGAGSIGAATVRALVEFRPRSLHVVDQNENGLVELVRDLRSRYSAEQLGDFRTFPIEFGCPLMERLLNSGEGYDSVLNFAALKHVRSEKDVYSILQMLETNVLKPARLLQWLAARGRVRRYFCVSTDKAANPVNLMGASKRLMEHVIFSEEVVDHRGMHVSSARFANVAFSDGSLLQGWLSRLSKAQPLAVPRATKRYFVSLEEAGQICLLAAFIAPDRRLLIPRLNPDVDLHNLSDLAAQVLEKLGFKAQLFVEEAAARRAAAEGVKRQAYPLLLTPLDTAGEKAFEEFLGADEQTEEIGLAQLLAVRYLAPPDGALTAWMESAASAMVSARSPITREELAAEIAKVVPEFQHVDSQKMLDQRL